MLVTQKGDKFAETAEGLIWGEVVGRHGGNVQLAEQSLRMGDVVAFRHPKNPNLIRFRIEEFNREHDEDGEEFNEENDEDGG